MKRLVLILILLSFAIIIAGCADINVTCGVDDSNNAFIKYEIEVSTDQVEANNATYIIKTLNTLEAHFNDLGFTTTREDFYLTAELKEPSDNYDAAVDNLKNMLTDEDISIFYDVSVQKITTEYEQGYYVSLSADYSTWVLEKGTAYLPSEIKSQIEEYASSEAGTLTLMLPANEASSTSGQVNISRYTAKTSVPIVLNKEISIDLSTKVSGDGTVKDKLSASNIITSKIIFSIILCLVSAVLLAIMIITLKRYFKAKKNHY
ncbi:MAG: hypothetical protein R2876_02325 [Eubacteriales bacterium]